MTVGVVCLDGLDWRLADDVGLFDPTPLTGQRLRNNLDGEHPLLTPRVWTSIMAGEDQRQVTGWMDRQTWTSSTRDLTFVWDRFPDTRVHDLRVHRAGKTRSTVMPVEFTGATADLDALKDTADRKVDYWKAELDDGQPQAVVAWFGFPDHAGHRAGKGGDDLRPAYVWMRDVLFDRMAWPDDCIVISDHGFRIPERNPNFDGSWAGRQAHGRDGTLATTDSLRVLRDYRDLTQFIRNWQGDVAALLRNRQLADLGYLNRD